MKLKRSHILSRLSLYVIATLFSASLLAQAKTEPVTINWLDGQKPETFSGTTFGVPWQRNMVAVGDEFVIHSGDDVLAVQTWPIAYWPDGSVKWTAVAVPPADGLSGNLKLVSGTTNQIGSQIKITETNDQITVNTGIVKTIINKKGQTIIESISRDGKEISQNGRLIVNRQNTPEATVETPVITTQFVSNISKVVLEQSGPLRAVVKLEGTHLSPENESLLPFVLRLYFYAGGDNVRMMHSIIYDGNEEKDFISGIGFRFNVPMHDAPHDRHIRFSGENNGLFAEAVKGLTGLRRDPGSEIISAQLDGRATPPVNQFPKNVQKGLPYIPSFGDYTLFQSSSNSFRIRKRTSEGHTWLTPAHGNRSNGAGYIGGPSGGMAFGIRNFWQSFPAQLDIRNAASPTSEVTLWLWAPEAGAMDLRFYHDGMDMDTYEKQWEGLEITYEDYEPGFGTPMGVARTSEMYLWAVSSTPERQEIVNFSEMVAAPPVLMADLKHIEQSGVFGGLWSVRDDSHPVKKQISERLDWLFDFYKLQQDQHKWYGFWDYGDFMHTYDKDRHVWRYDVGGYAWDNSELSTDIWLWYYFLHSGRADAFRMAEAMIRHTGEVDVHHIGPFAPLGSRHNVLHWGCSAKQLRISTVANRRYYYFLTADERIGDLMEAQMEAHRSLHDVPPLRKRANIDASDPNKVNLSFGTDWGSIASAWLTQWERTGDDAIRQRLQQSMESIAAQPKGFFTLNAYMDVESGIFEKANHKRITVSHLSAAFGLMEVCAELVGLIDAPSFKKAWLQYCQLYNASEKEQRAQLGSAFGQRNLAQGHSRLTAYVAATNNDEKLANRAWHAFVTDNPARSLNIAPLQTIEGPAVLSPVDEAPYISTNYAAQWGLAAIQVMKLIEKWLPDEIETEN